jgi:chromosome segregation ATPase
MSDEINGLDAPKQFGDMGSADKVDLAQLPQAVQDYIKSLRGEAAEKRKKLEALESKISEAEQKRLAEQGQYRELSEKLQSDVSNLTPYKTRVEALEQKIIATNNKRVELIPEHMRSLVPQLSPEDLSVWLDANEAKLTKPSAPNLDAGAGGAGGKVVPQLTAEQLAVAKGMGLTPEEFAKFVMKK